MACAFHPEREGVAVCASCEKELCEECKKEVGGKVYCPEHAEEALKAAQSSKISPPSPSAPTSEVQKTAEKSSTGLEPNLGALLAYILGWVTGLLFVLIEQKDKYIRFHAFQSLYFFGAVSLIQIIGIPVVATIFSRIPVFGWLFAFLLWSLNIVIGVVAFIFWILGMVKAYQGEWYKFPIAGEMAYKAVESR
jgi:uncharacterized membrane protein